MQKVGENTLIGASGDLSDYQKIMKMVHEMQTYDMAHDDGCSMTPRDFHQYMGRVMYNRSLYFSTDCNEHRLKRGDAYKTDYLDAICKSNMLLTFMI